MRLSLCALFEIRPQRCNELIGGFKGAVGPPLLHVFESLGKATIHDGRRGKGDLSSFYLSLKEVPFFNSQLLAEFAGDRNLAFSFDFNHERHKFES